MKTYAVRAARTKTTGHYRREGTNTLYCGKPAGAPNDFARNVKGFKLCRPCVKAEAADRAEAQATAAAHADDQTFPQPACTLHGNACTRDPKRRHIFRPAPKLDTAAQFAADFPTVAAVIAAEKQAAADAEEETRQAVALITEAEATDGTWRGQWIGQRTTTEAPALFPLDAEQGALFA